MNHSPDLSALNNALAIFQGQLKPVPKESTNPFYHTKYASLTAIWDNIREPLKANGLAVSQVTSVDNGAVILTTMLLHSSGQWLSGDYLLTPGQVKDKQFVEGRDPQAMGSALTYARRYALSAILGIVADEDDDAEATMQRGAPRTSKTAPTARPAPASKPEQTERPEDKVSEAQVRKIFATAGQMGYKDDETKALMKEKFKVEHTKDLTKKQASDLITAIEAGESVKAEELFPEEAGGELPANKQEGK